MRESFSRMRIFIQRQHVNVEGYLLKLVETSKGFTRALIVPATIKLCLILAIYVNDDFDFPATASWNFANILISKINKYALKQNKSLQKSLKPFQYISRHTSFVSVKRIKPVLRQDSRQERNRKHNNAKYKQD